MPMRMIILAAVASAAWAALAVAEPMRFENPTGADRIDWENFWLDITLPASEQTGVRTDSTAENSVFEEPPNDPHASEVTRNSNLSPGGSMSFLVEPNLVNIVPLQFGDLIGPGGQIPNGGAGSFFADVFVDGELSFSRVRFPLGRSFIGISFLDRNVDPFATHFGWMEVNLFQRPDGTHKVDALAWGYETEPETAVRAGIPTPGTAGAFVILGAVALRRRRRS